MPNSVLASRKKKIPLFFLPLFFVSHIYQRPSSAGRMPATAADLVWSDLVESGRAKP